MYDRQGIQNAVGFCGVARADGGMDKVVLKHVQYHVMARRCRCGQDGASPRSAVHWKELPLGSLWWWIQSVGRMMVFGRSSSSGSGAGTI